MAGSNYKDPFNDTKGRRISKTRSGFVANPGPENVFGNPEEIAVRVGRTYKSLPDNNQTNFKQLGPDGPGAANPNQGSARAYKGDQKFGNPRRYGV